MPSAKLFKIPVARSSEVPSSRNDDSGNQVHPYHLKLPPRLHLVVSVLPKCKSPEVLTTDSRSHHFNYPFYAVAKDRIARTNHSQPDRATRQPPQTHEHRGNRHRPATLHTHVGHMKSSKGKKSKCQGHGQSYGQGHGRGYGQGHGQGYGQGHDQGPSHVPVRACVQAKKSRPKSRPKPIETTVDRNKSLYKIPASPVFHAKDHQLPDDLRTLTTRGWLFTHKEPYFLVVYTDGSAKNNGKVRAQAGLGVWWGNFGDAAAQ